jgi:catechol 2,3-dioxygenase-like lactoylglutathione lyase family enzyme
MSDEPRAGAVLYAKDVERVVAFYAEVLGFETVGHDEGHVRLESSTFQLVVLRVPPRIASKIEVAVPPVRRDNTAVKLVFFVPSIAAVRATAPALGGVVHGAAKEWVFNGCKVCDGLDPEGNVIQFRESAG